MVEKKERGISKIRKAARNFVFGCLQSVSYNEKYQNKSLLYSILESAWFIYAYLMDLEDNEHFLSWSREPYSDKLRGVLYNLAKKYDSISIIYSKKNGEPIILYKSKKSCEDPVIIKVMKFIWELWKEGRLKEGKVAACALYWCNDWKNFITGGKKIKQDMIDRIKNLAKHLNKEQTKEESTNSDSTMPKINKETKPPSEKEESNKSENIWEF